MSAWPNPRLQRTPSAPLSRQPLGDTETCGSMSTYISSTPGPTSMGTDTHSQEPPR
jgi:hypothetical protein